MDEKSKIRTIPFKIENHKQPSVSLENMKKPKFQKCLERTIILSNESRAYSEAEANRNIVLWVLLNPFTEKELPMEIMRLSWIGDLVMWDGRRQVLGKTLL